MIMLIQLPTAQQVTNLYLYGGFEVPVGKADAGLIRGNNSTPLNVDVNTYMAGPGRFASVSKFEMVEKFMSPWFHPESLNLAPSTYTKEQLFSAFGISVGYVTIDQSMYDDGKDDFLSRAYIWNATAFKIHPGARFVVEVNGNRYIENFAIVPHSADNDRENFDFEAGTGFGGLANSLLQPKVDPSDIGRKVFFTFVGDVATTQFTFADYVEASNTAVTANPLLYAYIVANATAFLDELYNSGSTRFLDESGRFVIFGSDGNDALAPASFDNVAIDSQLRTAMNTLGVAIVSGHGQDVLNGGSKGDALYAGAGNDSLNGKGGVDYLEGGEGGDVLDGGADNDELNGGVGFDTYRFDAKDWGHDTIIDSDGVGRIEIGGIALGEFRLMADVDGVWVDTSGRYRAYKSVHGIVITPADRPGTATITIRSWGEDHNLGISFEKEESEEPGPEEPDGPPSAGVQGLYLVSKGNYDTLIGNAGNDILEGRVSNVLIGGGGDDYLIGGGGGFNILIGGLGDDSLSSYGSFSVVKGDAGADLIGSSGDYCIILGGSGKDSISGGGRYSIYNGGDGGDLLQVGGSGNIVNGEAGDDHLVSVGDDNILQGGADHDALWSEGERNILDGGEGNDYLESKEGAHGTVMRGGAGNDRLISEKASSTIVFNRGDGNDFVRADDQAIVELTGIGSTDVHFGRNFMDTTGQFSGRDLVLKVAVANGGQITLHQYLSADVLLRPVLRFTDGEWDYARVVAWLNRATSGSDALWGVDDVSNQIFGGDGSDTLTAGKLNDTLNGGRGNDTLNGGAGVNAFIFNHGDGQDVVNVMLTLLKTRGVNEDVLKLGSGLTGC